MAARFDVAERLAEGRPAAQHTQTYVRACEQAGYHHPDLGDPVSDWYDSEDGLDLHALDADCEQLRSATAVLAEAVRLQRIQVDTLMAAWEGPGADAAGAFLQRHCDTANALVAEVRGAAQRCESLRDNLWHLIDGKVATAVAIDDRALAQRPAWLAAAAAVATGDRAARDVIDQQLKPYVDNDIRNDWLAAMRSARAGVAACYDMVGEWLAGAPRAHFELPAELVPSGPPPPPLPPTQPRAPSAAAAVIPSGLTVPAGPASHAAVAPGASTPAAPVAPPVGAAGVTDGGMSGGGLPGGGLSGLGGLASRIVQAMGDLLGPAGDQFGDPDDPLAERHPRKPEADPDTERDSATKKLETVDSVGGVARTPPATDPPASAAGSPQSSSPPPVVNPPAPEPTTAGRTPCEIAADELPQAGQ